MTRLSFLVEVEVDEDRYAEEGAENYQRALRRAIEHSQLPAPYKQFSNVVVVFQDSEEV